MSQNYSYPPGFATAVNPSVGSNGSAAPTNSTLVGAKDPSNDLQPLLVDASGNLKVNVATTTTTPLPTTDLADGPVTPGTVATKSILMGGQYNTALPTLTNTQQSAIQVDSSGRPIISPLSSTSTVTVVQPTGTNLHAVIDSGTIAATQSGNWNTRTQDGSGNAITSTGSALDINLKTSSITIPVSGTVTANQGTSPWVDNISQFGGSSVSLGQKMMESSIPVVIASDQTSVPASQSGNWNINNISGTISLPTGAATSANQTTISGQLPSTLGQKVSASSLAVVVASDQSSIATTSTSQGNTPLTFVRNDYSSVNVTTSAYTQLIASTSGITNVVEIFDSSGQTLKIAFGGSGSELDQFIVYPGGNGRITCRIPASTRISIKAISATANSGEIDMNLYT